MSAKSAPTANELIVMAGLDKSPDQIVKRARKLYDKTYSKITNPSFVRERCNRYVEWRLKDLSTDKDTVMTVLLSLSALAIPPLIVGGLPHTTNGVLSAYMATIIAAIHITGSYARSEDNTRAMKESIEVEGLLTSYRKSLLHRIWFMLRNVVLSPFDLLLLHKKKEYDERRGRKIVTNVPLFNPTVAIRQVYIQGLKRVENELIGPESDWSKTLVDLRARNDKATQQQDRLDARIKEAQRAGDDDRYRALVSTKTRLRVSERGLVEAIESTHQLIIATRNEIAKLYKLVDSMGDTYADAELIAEIDQSIDGNERAVDHAKQLRDQAYEKISLQLTAVAATVIGHKLLPNPAVDAIDMPRYLEEVEKATEAIVKISES